MCPKLIELLSWNRQTVHVCCFMLARASTKTFASRVQKNGEKIFVSRKIRQQVHSLAEASLYFPSLVTVTKISQAARLLPCIRWGLPHESTGKLSAVAKVSFCFVVLQGKFQDNTSNCIKIFPSTFIPIYCSNLQAFWDVTL